MGRTLASFWTWTVLGFCLLLWIPLMAILLAITWPFDHGRYWVGRFFRYAGITAVKANPLWHFRWKGVVPIDRRRPAVVVSNHESFADILLISHLPWEMKWLSKAEIMRLPVLGWCMRMAGDIPVWRGKNASTRDAMAMAKRTLDRGVSVMIFPEGTRSPNQDLLPFKDGAFRLAIEAGVPVLPVVISGTRDALAKHDWRMNRADATVQILDTVETTGLTLADVAALKERVRIIISNARDQLRASTP